MKRKLSGILSLVACLLIMSTLSLADSGGKHRGMGYGHGLAKKLLHRFHLVLGNQDELNLSNKQVAKTRELKRNTKKHLIRRKAEIDLISVDIKSELGDVAIDKKVINELIDQKYELKKAKAKSLIDAFVELENILTKEQNKRLKDISCKRHRMKQEQL